MAGRTENKRDGERNCPLSLVVEKSGGTYFVQTERGLEEVFFGYRSLKDFSDRRREKKNLALSFMGFITSAGDKISYKNCGDHFYELEQESNNDVYLRLRYFHKEKDNLWGSLTDCSLVVIEIFPFGGSPNNESNTVCINGLRNQIEYRYSTYTPQYECLSPRLGIVEIGSPVFAQERTADLEVVRDFGGGCCLAEEIKVMVLPGETIRIGLEISALHPRTPVSAKTEEALQKMSCVRQVGPIKLEIEVPLCHPPLVQILSDELIQEMDKCGWNRHLALKEKTTAPLFEQAEKMLDFFKKIKVKKV